jgi:hypothetical protein
VTSRAIVSQVLAAVCLAAIATAGCEKGPAQRTGERVDDALGQGKAVGKGPVEHAGKNVDKAIDDLKK